MKGVKSRNGYLIRLLYTQHQQHSRFLMIYLVTLKRGSCLIPYKYLSSDYTTTRSHPKCYYIYFKKFNVAVNSSFIKTKKINKYIFHVFCVGANVISILKELHDLAKDSKRSTTIIFFFFSFLRYCHRRPRSAWSDSTLVSSVVPNTAWANM